MPQLLAKLRTLGSKTVVIYFSIFNDGAGAYFIAAEAAPLVAEASAASVYGLYDTYLGSGIVGGCMETFEFLGRETARLALRVLAGEKPENIAPYFLGDGVTIVDWRQLRRWGLDEGLLPPGSEVRYRQPSLWDRYRMQILAGLGLLVLQTVVIVGLIINRIRRIRAERSLCDSRGEARQLAGRLLSAQEDERRRIARELHDDLSQRLAASAIEAGKLEHQLPESPALREIFTRLKDELIALSENVHHLSHQIHPTILEDLGLEAALRSECDRMAARDGTPVTLRCGLVPPDLPPDVSLCLYRIAQEALWNAVRHASTDRIEVFLGADAEGIHLEVRDFGDGFDPEAAAGNGSLGLASMKERVRLVCGRLAINSTRRVGTKIAVNIPLSEREP